MIVLKSGGHTMTTQSRKNTTIEWGVKEDNEFNRNTFSNNMSTLTQEGLAVEPHNRCRQDWRGGELDA